MVQQITDNIEVQLLNIIRELLTESKRERALHALSLDASLEKDLGIGSLEKVELFHRIEQTFSIQFSEADMVQVDVIRDLIATIQHAGAMTPSVKSQATAAPLSMSTIDPANAKTLVEVLFQYAEEEPNRPHIYLQDEHGDEKIITYGELYRSALTMAQNLYDRGLKPKETVAIMLPTCEEFFYVFFGVLLAGGVPVPIYPPYRPNQIEEYAKREVTILRNAEVTFLITFAQAETLSKLLSSFIPTLKGVVTAENLKAPTQVTMPPRVIREDDAGLIQYTSGSTSDPKGVLLFHQNLLANIRAYGKGIDVSPKDVIVSWLPLYHDMGLIGAWLGSFYYGVPVVIMSPMTFLTRPERWLWAIHYHRGTISAGPNFSYELCIRKIDDKAIEGLDLSSLRLAFNGAEAVHPKTLRRFTERFVKYGFKPEIFYPVYGLAESSVALTFPPQGRLPRIDKISRDLFVMENKAVPVTSDNEPFIEFPSCGKPLPGHEVRIVDDNGEDVPERVRGVLEFRGPSSMQGYYRNPQATAAAFHDGWVISGDYAYLADGEVYVTGRKKDVIIKAGRNFHPEGIEDVVGHIKGVRRGCVVAFGTNDPPSGTEKLVVVAETAEQNPLAREKMISEAIEKVAEAVGVPPDDVVLVAPATIPKTSSGKLRRSSCKDMYIKDELQHKRAVWNQLLRISLQSMGMRAKHGLGKIGKMIYAVYLAIFILVTALPLWLVSFFLPRAVIATLVKIWCRGLFLFGFCRIKVKGRENLRLLSKGIYVANHASYIDPLVLLAVLPTNVLFVAKQEVLKAPLLRKFIRKLGHLTVDRADIAQSIKDAKQIEIALSDHHSVAFFPEGTFTEKAGLTQFRAGAFKLAVETQLPVIPVALNGTRQVLRGNTLLPSPGVIEVTICESINIEGHDWHEVGRLNDLSRREIAKYCGEYLLDKMSEIRKSE